MLVKYKNIVPEILLEIWQDEGFCQFQQGLYNIINPDDWQDVVDVWMENTPFQQLGNFYALARNAFGCIYIIQIQNLD
ncbi:GAD-like domain-containing protein [Acinetobacter sp. P8-3-8]|uniref:GAD-like domain-containing protein n=1 Tax=Acinetobacter sp. P8-3-8 TaxID=1029823 RepID=UPI0009D749D7